MNRYLLLLAILTGFQCFGQSSPNPKEVKNTTVTSKPLPEPVNPGTPVSFSTVEECDHMIEALDRRIAVVRSDEKKNAEAEKSGWFDRIEAERQRYVIRRDELLKTSNGKL